MTEDNRKIDNQSKEADEGPSLSWKTHPMKRKPWVTLLVTFFNLVVSGLVFYATSSRFFSFLALVVLFASLGKFYFPTSYTMNKEGITIRTSTQTLAKRWSQYRSFYPDKNGVLLSPFTERSRLENFRGIYIMYEASNKDEVVAFVKKYIGTGKPIVSIDNEQGMA